jgi:hypothetical protein
MVPYSKAIMHTEIVFKIFEVPKKNVGSYKSEVGKE